MECMKCVDSMAAPYICHSSIICSSNAGFARFHPQIVEDDDQFSSSEGSTVDDIAGRDGGESVDFELEESMEPDACFPDGKYNYNHCRDCTKALVLI